MQKAGGNSRLFYEIFDISTEDANIEASKLYYIISDEAVEKMSELLGKKENTGK